MGLTPGVVLTNDPQNVSLKHHESTLSVFVTLLTKSAFEVKGSIEHKVLFASITPGVQMNFEKISCSL